MPNPTDADRAGDATTRSTKLLNSAGNTANTKKSWSEWFGSASNSWLGSTMGAYGADKAAGGVSGMVQEGIATKVQEGATKAAGALLGTTKEGAAKMAAIALGTTLAGITGFWVVGAAGVVLMEAVGKKLEDKAKECIPNALSSARAAVGRHYFGSGEPDVELNKAVKKDGEEHTLEDTMERIKTNSALLQDLLNKMAGVAGKPYYCDDAYHIGALAQKCATTKLALLADIGLLRDFLKELRTDLDKIDPAAINDKVKALAKAICEASDGRHWDNTWSAATVKRMFRCSKEHCFGPR